MLLKEEDGVEGESEEVEELDDDDDAGDNRGDDEVVDGGDMGDLYGMFMAPLKAREG